MERNSLSIELRETSGKRSARRMRLEGRIPAILYGRATQPVVVSVNVRELRKALSGKGGLNTLLDLQGGAGVGGKLAIVKDVQHDPITNAPTHIDLYELKIDQKIHVMVPIHLVGKAKGTIEGGIVTATLREISIEVLPNDIPGAIDVDITALDIGDSIHVRDLVLPTGVRALGDQGASIVTVVPPASEEKAVEVAAVAGTEPEVLTAKAEKAEGGAAAPAKPGAKPAGK